jgi:hypothetical protein
VAAPWSASSAKSLVAWLKGKPMPNVNSRTAALAVSTAIALMAHTLLARVDVKVEFDRAFDFKSVKTWAWDPSGPGQVKMARTQTDDPEAMQQRAEPVIVDAVRAEAARRGLQAAASTPDVVITYYLLLTTNLTGQTLGQFLPAVAEWGLPPFPPATQSLSLMNQGSLVLDLTAMGKVVWRGVANAKIKVDANDKQREGLLREAVRDLLRRFPPR